MATKKATTKAIEHPITPQPISDVESVKCECCGLTEECTPPYIRRVRDRHDGRWICGLCSEAVNDEALRSTTAISTAEAVNRHIEFHSSFASSISSPPDPVAEDHLISAVKLLLRRSIESPTKGGGDPSPSSLARSNSCFAAVPRRRCGFD